MFGIRYHIASLAAVLLSLGIGIWIGSALGFPAILKQQTHLLRDATQKLDFVVQEHAHDQDQLHADTQALSAMVPQMTRGLLTGKTVALVRTGDYDDAVVSAKNAVEQAGATVVSVTTITDRFDMISDKEMRQLTTGSAIQSTIDDSLGTNDRGIILKSLVDAWKFGAVDHNSDHELIERLQNANIITYTGDFSQSANLILLVGGSSAGPGDPSSGDDISREKLLLTQILGAGGFDPESVAGCEPSDAATSSIPGYQQEAIPSVDCIDQPLGALDLVYALNGSPGTYGTKPTADKLLPDSLVNAGTT